MGSDKLGINAASGASSNSYELAPDENGIHNT